ncbi:MAG: HTTM domain-containing protein [Bacteroidia bacterium]
MNINKPTAYIDSAQMALFRMLFGFLLAAETGGAILTGWVRRGLVEPDFTFTFIGFEWLRIFNGPFMYGWFAVMALLGIAVMLGWRYRLSLGFFTFMWTISYLMQKSHYNNHYYLLILLCLLMLLVPAHSWASLDARRDARIRALAIPAWTRDIIILLLGIVYTYAAIAKVQTDWLSGDNTAMWFNAKKGMPIIGSILTISWLPKFVAWAGFLFDLLIIPLLLWRPTRWLAVGFAIVFHIFNAAVFHIGIFPFLMLGTLFLFFPSGKIRERFFPKKPKADINTIVSPIGKWTIPLALFFLVQLTLPLRHHLLPGDVNWTEEGHRMAWRMMLRYKHSKGTVYATIDNGPRIKVPHTDHLSRSQARKLFTHPDIAWQYVQWLKQNADTLFPEKEAGQVLAVYFDSKVALNGHTYKPLIDPEVDMTQAKWSMWKRSPWILD